MNAQELIQQVVEGAEPRQVLGEASGIMTVTLAVRDPKFGGGARLKDKIFLELTHKEAANGQVVVSVKGPKGETEGLLTPSEARAINLRPGKMIKVVIVNSSADGTALTVAVPQKIKEFNTK